LVIQYKIKKGGKYNTIFAPIIFLGINFQNFNYPLQYTLSFYLLRYFLFSLLSFGWLDDPKGRPFGRGRSPRPTNQEKEERKENTGRGEEEIEEEEKEEIEEERESYS
jgi:hypothetical protein